MEDYDDYSGMGLGPMQNEAKFRKALGTTWMQFVRSLWKDPNFLKEYPPGHKLRYKMVLKAAGPMYRQKFQAKKPSKPYVDKRTRLRLRAEKMAQTRVMRQVRRQKAKEQGVDYFYANPQQVDMNAAKEIAQRQAQREMDYIRQQQGYWAGVSQQLGAPIISNTPVRSRVESNQRRQQQQQVQQDNMDENL